MKKSQLKQLIREVIQEIDNRPGADTSVDIDLSKLGKGLTGKLEDVLINYTHTDIEYSKGEEPSEDSPGGDEEFYFEVTYTAYEATNTGATKVFDAGDEIPEEAIDGKQVEKIQDSIIEDFIDSARRSYY